MLFIVSAPVWYPIMKSGHDQKSYDAAFDQCMVHGVAAVATASDPMCYPRAWPGWRRLLPARHHRVHARRARRALDGGAVRCFAWLCVVVGILLALTAPLLGQESRTGVVTISSMKREFGSLGPFLYELRLTRPGGRLHSVTATKADSPCEGFFVGEEDIQATYTASTITLNRGKNVCRLTIRQMF